MVKFMDTNNITFIVNSNFYDFGKYHKMKGLIVSRQVEFTMEEQMKEGQENDKIQNI